MLRKFLKINICIIAMLCMFCSSFTVFAEPDDLDFDFNIQPIEPTTQAETIPVETEKETQKETEKQTEKETEKVTQRPTQKPTQSPTRRPTDPQTTRRENPEPDNNVWQGNNNDNNDNANENANVQANVQTTKNETTEDAFEEDLEKGEFYVYLERNNGQRRLKTLMKKTGHVPEPEEPVREGYVFSGWYADSEFKKPWNFITDKANKKMTIYAKWTAVGDTVVHDIVIKDCVGGTLEVNPQKASVGEPVVITVIPDEGKRLVQGSVVINGESTDFLNFIMPDKKVTISASFEDVPENELEPSKSRLPMFIVIGVIAVLIIAVVIVIAKRRSDFNADLDPEEDISVEEDNDDENWIDESIVVEDGFANGKKIVESIEPDYGTPDSDEDE